MICEEENGDIVGYDASDKRHGGEGDPPLPPYSTSRSRGFLRAQRRA